MPWKLRIGRLKVVKRETRPFEVFQGRVNEKLPLLRVTSTEKEALHKLVGHVRAALRHVANAATRQQNVETVELIVKRAINEPTSELSICVKHTNELIALLNARARDPTQRIPFINKPRLTVAVLHKMGLHLRGKE
jgi:hypothetical protein